MLGKNYDKFLASNGGFWGKIRDIVAVKADLSGECERMKLIEAISTQKFYSTDMECTEDEKIQINLMHINKSIKSQEIYGGHFFMESYHYDNLRENADNVHEASILLDVIMGAYQCDMYGALDILTQFMDEAVATLDNNE